MAVDITRKGGTLKIDDGTNPKYYPIDDVRYEIEGAVLNVFHNTMQVHTFSNADITTPSGATLEDKADAIGVLFESDSTSNSALSSVAATTSNVELLAANADRKEAVIVNDGLQNLFIKYGAVATQSSYTFKLGSGETLIVDNYTGKIDGIWNIANGDAVITEMT